MIEPGDPVVHLHQALARNSSKNYHDFDDSNPTPNSTVVPSVNTTFQHLILSRRGVRSLTSPDDSSQILSLNPIDPIAFKENWDDGRYALGVDGKRFFDSSDLIAQPHVLSVDSSADAFNDDMNTVSTSAPDSPPDLSASRSSKSSSYCSTSQFSTADGILNDITNFEEIGLGDDGTATGKTASQVDTDVVSKSTRSVPRSRSPKTPLSPLKVVVPVSNVGNPALLAIRGQSRDLVNARVRDNSLRSQAVGRLERRGFTSPSVPVLPVSTDSAEPRTRSTSPAHRYPTLKSSASQSAYYLQPVSSLNRSSLPLPPRTNSWSFRRKSTLESEAECHDSDEELPDEASLWNVPMSPRPPEERISPDSSSRGSPERPSEARNPQPIPLAHAQTVPESPPMKAPHSRILPRHRTLPPRSSSLQSSPLVDASPTSPTSRPPWRSYRAKSWTFAMSELSEEARILSENLEFHADTAEREQEKRVQAGLAPRSARPSLESRSNRNSYSAIQLPPLQRGGDLDFLPVSKEKEALLSRTRPSWLPPKDPKEERRHLKQYQKMMAASIVAERKREQRLHLQKCAKDDSREALHQMWEQYIDDSRDALDTDEGIRDLCWRGVSSKARGQVWQRATGNQLALTAASYEKASGRAKAIQKKDPHDLSDKERSILEWFCDIERDAETAFPDLGLFQRHGPLWHDLIDVCEAYACYRSDIGYVYGVQLVGALLLLQLHSPSAVFVLLANCLNRPTAHAFLANDGGSMSKTYSLAMSTLATKFPRLHGYLFNDMERGGLSMSGEAVFEPMLRTLFANGLDVDHLSRVWDCWIFEGDRVLVTAAVAILGTLQTQIFDIAGGFDTKRRNVQEMLGWGPFGRTAIGGYWDLTAVPGGNVEGFVDEVREVGKLDYTGR